MMARMMPAMAGRGRFSVPRESTPLVFLGGGAAGVTAASVVPGLIRFVPRCPVHAMTGLDCPGCGATRAVLALTRGDLSAAVGHNVLFVAALPLLALAWTAWYRSRRSGHPWPGWLRSRAALIAGVTLALAFAVVRNLPLTVFQPLRA